MKITWFLVVFLIGSLSDLVDSKKAVEHFEISSNILNEVVKLTIEDCQTKIKCDKVEYLYIEIDTTDGLTVVSLDTVRKRLNSDPLIFELKRFEIVSFYIGKTLCFSDRSVLSIPKLFESIKKSDSLNLADYPFKYSCLDIESEGEIYHTLIYSEFILKKGEIKSQIHTTYIDCGDADISKALEERGIKE